MTYDLFSIIFLNTSIFEEKKTQMTFFSFFEWRSFKKKSLSAIFNSYDDNLNKYPMIDYYDTIKIEKLWIRMPINNLIKALTYWKQLLTLNFL